MQRIKEKKHEIVYADEGIFGSGCVSENGAELKALGSRAMIVTGKHSSRINGSLAAVEQALQANGQTYVIFDEIEENPSVETVAVAAGIAVKEQVDFFVAVGGGSPMDASKAISLLAANPSAIDHAEERLYHPEPMQGYPVAAVPTTSGTGSEVTPYAILTRHDLHTKQSIAHKWFADLAFVDAGYLKTSSYENMVSTCVDALAHLIESYLNTNANAYNRIYSAEGLRIWGSAKEYLLSSGIKIPDEGYETFMHASVVAGMAIAHTGTSIPHGLSYPVTYELGIPHGKAVGFFLPGFCVFTIIRSGWQRCLSCLGLRTGLNLSPIWTSCWANHRSRRNCGRRMCRNCCRILPS